MSPRERTHARKPPFSCSRIEAEIAANEIFSQVGKTEQDRHNWACYCRFENRTRITDKAYELASRKRLGEIRDSVTAFQRWLMSKFPETTAYLQSFSKGGAK